MVDDDTAAPAMLPVAVLALLLALLIATAPPARAQGSEPLPGDATTGPSQAEGTVEPNTVVDVKGARLDGFDRVTFTYVGDGQPGWDVAYEEDPRSDGSGLPINFDGEIALRVVLKGIAFPPDATADTFRADVDGPDGGIVNEVVNASWFEGWHTFVVGLDDRVPYRIGVVDDPSRVVVELVHEVPSGPVDAGLGGGSNDDVLVVVLVGIGGALLAAGVLVALRRRGTG